MLAFSLSFYLNWPLWTENANEYYFSYIIVSGFLLEKKLRGGGGGDNRPLFFQNNMLLFLKHFRGQRLLGGWSHFGGAPCSRRPGPYQPNLDGEQLYSLKSCRCLGVTKLHPSNFIHFLKELLKRWSGAQNGFIHVP